MNDMERQQLEALREHYILCEKIAEMQQARDRQAAEWRRMINSAMARKSTLQKRLSSLGVAVRIAEGSPAPEEDDKEEDDK